MTLQAFDKQAKVRAGCGGAAAVSVAGGVVAVFSAWLAYTDSVGAAQMFSQGQRTTKLIFSKSERGQKAFALDYCAAGFVTEGEPPPGGFWERDLEPGARCSVTGPLP